MLSLDKKSVGFPQARKQFDSVWRIQSRCRAEGKVDVETNVGNEADLQVTDHFFRLGVESLMKVKTPVVPQKWKQIFHRYWDCQEELPASP